MASAIDRGAEGGTEFRLLFFHVTASFPLGGTSGIASSASIGYNVAMSTSDYLDRFLEPVTDAFTPELARKIVELRAEPRLQARIDELADKASQGTLSPEEEQDYKNCIEAADIIGIFQAKARRFLASH